MKLELEMPEWIWIVIAIWLATKTIVNILKMIQLRQRRKLNKIEHDIRIQNINNHG